MTHARDRGRRLPPGRLRLDQGDWCAVLPLTIPVNTRRLRRQQRPRPGQHAWPWNTVLTVPLCKAAPGNVGWLDWDPPAGGASEIVCSIVNSDNPAIILPSWQYIAATGNTNGGGGCADVDTGVEYRGVEEAIRKYNGQIVLIPQFDMTCRTKNGDPDPISTQPTINTPPNYGCPNPPGGGNGQNIWYRMPSFAYFELCDPAEPGCGGRHGAYIRAATPPSATPATARRRASSASSRTSWHRDGRPGRRLRHRQQGPRGAAHQVAARLSHRSTHIAKPSDPRHDGRGGRTRRASAAVSCRRTDCPVP